MAAKRRGVSIFRGSSAPLLDDTDFMYASEMSEETQASISTNLVSGALTGSQLKVLVRQDADQGGFSLVHIWFKPDYPLPRHTHDADCMYYIISGSLTMGNQTLRAGDSFFVPAEAPYAYSAGATGVEVLEIRHGVTTFAIGILDASPHQWESMLQTLLAHRTEWEGLETSPTFAS